MCPRCRLECHLACVCAGRLVRACPGDKVELAGRRRAEKVSDVNRLKFPVKPYDEE